MIHVCSVTGQLKLPFKLSNLQTVSVVVEPAGKNKAVYLRTASGSGNKSVLDLNWSAIQPLISTAEQLHLPVA